MIGNIIIAQRNKLFCYKREYEIRKEREMTLKKNGTKPWIIVILLIVCSTTLLVTIISASETTCSGPPDCTYEFTCDHGLTASADCDECPPGSCEGCLMGCNGQNENCQPFANCN